MRQPLGMIDEFRRRAAFGAQRLACRMRGIVFQSGEAATFDHRDRAAAGDTEPAIDAEALRSVVLGHTVAPRGKNACPIRPEVGTVSIGTRLA